MGDEKVDLEHVFMCTIVVLLSTCIFGVALFSALSKDNEALKAIRKTWRLKISKKRKAIKSVRPGEDQEVVPASRNVAVDAPLKREVAWKKLHGDVFRKPNFSTVLSTLIGQGV